MWNNLTIDGVWNSNVICLFETISISLHQSFSLFHNPSNKGDNDFAFLVVTLVKE
jgi:hypothetical protein